MRVQREMVVLLAGEPREVVYDHEVNLALACPAVLQGESLRSFDPFADQTRKVIWVDGLEKVIIELVFQ